MAKYSITKDPNADNVFALSKDPDATEIQITKNPGSATATFQKNAATKVRLSKGESGTATPQPDLYIPLISDLVADTGTATTTVTRALNTGTDEDAAGLISTINANLPRFYRGLGVLSESLAKAICINDAMLLGAAGTLTSDDITAPDGSVNGDLFTCDTSTAAHYLQRVASNNVAHPTDYVAVGMFKPGTETVFQITTGSPGFGSNAYANFICTGSGSVGDTGSSIVDAGCTLRPDGWYDCWMSMPTTANGTPTAFVCFTGNNSSFARFGSFTGASETGHVWGVGIVGLDLYRTRHVPVLTAAAVIRNADVIEVDESLPNPTACNDVSWGLDYTPLHDSGETDYLWTSQSDTDNGIYVYYDGTIFRCRKRLAGSNYDAYMTVNVVTGQTYRVLCRLDSSAGVSISIDGVAGTSHVNTTDAVIDTTCELGSNGTGGGQTSIVISEYKRYD